MLVEVLDQDRDGLGLFKLAQDFEWNDPVRGKITVPTGYVTDFASIPRPFRGIFVTAGKCAKPAVLHDYVNARGVTENTRAQQRWSTGIFSRALKTQGVPAWQRWPMVLFVAVFTFPEHYL